MPRPKKPPAFQLRLLKTLQDSPRIGVTALAVKTPKCQGRDQAEIALDSLLARGFVGAHYDESITLYSVTRAGRTYLSGNNE